MISFRTFFRQKMAKSFILLFAAMLLLANLTVCFVSAVQYDRQIARQEDSFVEMLRHTLVSEDEDTLIAFLEHYGHTHGVDLAFTDVDGTLVYATETAPAVQTPIPILAADGAYLGAVTIGYRQSFYGIEILEGLALVNGVSAVLFIVGMFLLRRYLNAQYAILYEDLRKIGTADSAFRFGDLRDLNERHVAALRAEAELKALQAHYVRLLAHDVKTPLTVMKAYLEGIRSGRIAFDDDVNAELLAEIAAIEKTVPQFIEQDLRQVAVAQNVAPLAASQLDKFAEVFKTKAMTVSTTLEDLTLTIAAADFLRLLEHLVFNAFYYSEPGKTITVRIEAELKRLTVADQGIGMSEQTLARIRDGGYRDPGAVKYNQKGSGIGYSIVFEIAKRIGADVEIASEPGIGTTVKIWFERTPLDGTDR